MCAYNIYVHIWLCLRGSSARDSEVWNLSNQTIKKPTNFKFKNGFSFVFYFIYLFIWKISSIKPISGTNCINQLTEHRRTVWELVQMHSNIFCSVRFDLIRRSGLSFLALSNTPTACDKSTTEHKITPFFFSKDKFPPPRALYTSLLWKNCTLLTFLLGGECIINSLW